MMNEFAVFVLIFFPNCDGSNMLFRIDEPKVNKIVCRLILLPFMKQIVLSSGIKKRVYFI